RTCAPSARTSSGVNALTVAWVPTGIKAGVSTGPCAVIRRPRRAPASSAISSNILWLPRLRGRVRVGACDEHAVTEAVKAVALADRLGVGGKHVLAAGEGAHQHQQRALGQMEVGQHGVHHAELVAGKDEKAGPALP